MKNTLIATLLLCLIIIGYLWNYSNSEVKTNRTKLTQTIHKKHIDTSTKKTISVEEQEKDTTDTNIDLVKNMNKDMSDEVKNLFEEEDIDDTLLTIEALKGITPVAAVSMKKETIKNIKIGDTLLLPTIDGVNYELKITDRSVSSNGNVSLNGSYEESGVTYNSILTEGKNSAFISMMTPTGTYEVEIVKGKGFVYSTADIENARIDYSKSDTLDTLEDDHHHEDIEA